MSDDTMDATARLEAALERIAASAHPAAAAPAPAEPSVDVAELAGRLDAVIAKLRGELAPR